MKIYLFLLLSISSFRSQKVSGNEISGHDIGGLGALSSGNHHIIIRITDNHAHLGQISHEVSKVTESLNKTDGLLIGIVVALAVASLLIKQYPLCLVENLFREGQEKSPFACMAKELVRYPTLGEECADEDGGIKHGAWHGVCDTL